MGVYALKLDPMKLRDIDEIVAILQPITGDIKIRRRIKQHIRDGVCRIMRDENKDVCAFGMAIGNAYEVSLSYYWVREDKRRTFASLWIFMGLFSYFKNKKIFIYSKDISTFKSYVELTKKKNVYRFIGMGNNIDVDKMRHLMESRSWEE